MISPQTALTFLDIWPKKCRTLVSANAPSCCLQAAQISYHNQAHWSGPTVHMYKFTFQGKKTTHPITRQCHKHIHTYGRIACNACLSWMFFSWTAAANGRLSVIGSAYGASGCHQRFRSAVGSFPDPGAASHHGDEDAAGSTEKSTEKSSRLDGKTRPRCPWCLCEDQELPDWSSRLKTLCFNLFMGCVMRDIIYCFILLGGFYCITMLLCAHYRFFICKVTLTTVT